MPNLNQKIGSNYLSPASLLFLGVLLICASFLPLEWTISQSWNSRDSELFDRISLEYHQSAFQSAGRAGRTDDDMQDYRANLKQQFESMREKLQYAQAKPLRWSRYLLWLGGALVATGCLAQFARRD